MFAADTSSLVAFFSGADGVDVEAISDAFLTNELALPPLVVTELLCDHRAAPAIERELNNLLTLELRDGYWIRAGHSRRLLLRQGLKAKTADTLIAQACIDHDVALITRDRDFRHFQKHCGLRLA